MGEVKEVKVTFKLKGAEDLDALVETLYRQINEMRATLNKIGQVTLELEAEVNQPPADTSG